MLDKEERKEKRKKMGRKEFVSCALASVEKGRKSSNKKRGREGKGLC